jgi:uncharacterized cofD-like protein
MTGADAAGVGAPGGPKVVALGGGHGTAVTLRAVRRYAAAITAVVSVADDGGSTGRLRAELDVVALGDIRKCLGALAIDSSVLARAFEYRFGDGELAGHALGNLVLAGLVEATGDLVAGVDEAGALLGAVGRVLPATTDKVTLKADGPDGEVRGQVAVNEAGRIRRVSLVPGGPTPPPEAVEALIAADQVVIGPGSLYTSVLAAVAVPGIADAVAATSGQRVYVCNLRPELPETADYDVGDHVAALKEHGVDVDVVLWDPSAGVSAGRVDCSVVGTALTGPNGLVHDPARLAEALCRLLR